ncbi:hypothetical protein EDD16DRAFT_1527481 [Pisolithus croceorrhizus]|nr:hypothetical protein EV401DRAFT_1896009 [Pisolithus croceorrhizus]KAI6097721.1 hypothetical protein EDD16DRAFT_1527481 [Pisolithus croceorrhizus]KAI6167221.1 hypothetical protein EDD17DRAFT_1504399 [Pisolithus thermaeus]
MDAAKMVQAFTQTVPSKVPLSTLEKEYNKKNQRMALSHLTQQHQMEVNERYLHDVGDSNLAWGVNDHFIDLMVMVTDGIGLHAIIPQSNPDPSYVFKLDLYQWHHTWKVKHGELGFNPVGWMLYIGTYNQEEIWMVMALQSFTAGKMASGTNVIEAPSSAMTQQHFCMLITLLAHQLHAGGFKDMQIWCRYPEKLTEKDMREYMNIFVEMQHLTITLDIANAAEVVMHAIQNANGHFDRGHRLVDREVHEMTYREVRSLHTKIVSKYESFVCNALDEWLEDSYLQDNAPIMIAVQYGQNQQICHPNSINKEGNHWNQLH